MFVPEKIKDLAHATPAASSVFLLLSKRQRSRRVLNLKQLKRNLRSNNVVVDDKEYLELFKSLQNMSVGDLIYGRKGNPDIFVWKYDLKDVAKIGLGETTTQVKAIEAENHRASRSRRPNPNVFKAITTDTVSDIGGAIKLTRTPERQIVISIPMEMFKSLF